MDKRTRRKLVWFCALLVLASVLILLMQKAIGGSTIERRAITKRVLKDWDQSYLQIGLDQLKLSWSNNFMLEQGTKSGENLQDKSFERMGGKYQDFSSSEESASSDYKQNSDSIETKQNDGYVFEREDQEKDVANNDEKIDWRQDHKFGRELGDLPTEEANRIEIESARTQELYDTNQIREEKQEISYDDDETSISKDETYEVKDDQKDKDYWAPDESEERIEQEKMNEKNQRIETEKNKQKIETNEDFSNELHEKEENKNAEEIKTGITEKQTDEDKSLGVEMVEEINTLEVTKSMSKIKVKKTDENTQIIPQNFDEKKAANIFTSEGKKFSDEEKRNENNREVQLPEAKPNVAKVNNKQEKQGEAIFEEPKHHRLAEKYSKERPQHLDGNTLDHDTRKLGNKQTEQQTPEQCQMTIAETLPEGLFKLTKLETPFTIHAAWVKLFKMAKSKIEIVSYHWGLRRGSQFGQEVYDVLAAGISERNLIVKIIHTSNHTDEEAYDTIDLMHLNPDRVEVRSINVAMLLNSVGVLHSKLLIADRKHFYLGSANLSDRGLTRTKEMGVLITNCPRLAVDAAKLFEVYWELAKLGMVPTRWDETFASKINLHQPHLIANGADGGNLMKAYLSSSPHQFCPSGRTDDLKAILSTIDAASKFVHVAVADYVPMRIFGEREYWPVIDDRLRMAAINRNVSIRLLVSDRANSRPYMKQLLKSLLQLNGLKQVVKIEIKLFAAKIPHFRSSHNKYMVTDKAGYIGTSNWTKDYFTQTAGLAFIFESTKKVSNQKDLRERLDMVFWRDWNSQWSKPLA